MSFLKSVYFVVKVTVPVPYVVVCIDFLLLINMLTIAVLTAEVRSIN